MRLCVCVHSTTHSICGALRGEHDAPLLFLLQKLQMRRVSKIGVVHVVYGAVVCMSHSDCDGVSVPCARGAAYCRGDW